MSGRSNRGLSAIARVKMGAVLSSRYYVMNGRIQMGRVEIYIVILSKKGFRPPSPRQTKIPLPLGKNVLDPHMLCNMCVHVHVEFLSIVIFIRPYSQSSLETYGLQLAVTHAFIKFQFWRMHLEWGGGGNIYNQAVEKLTPDQSFALGK